MFQSCYRIGLSESSVVPYRKFQQRPNTDFSAAAFNGKLQVVTYVADTKMPKFCVWGCVWAAKKLANNAVARPAPPNTYMRRMDRWLCKFVLLRDSTRMQEWVLKGSEANHVTGGGQYLLVFLVFQS